jgi:hypothetical protein
MKMHQMILNEKDEISSEAFFTFGFMDLKERKLISPTEICGLRPLGINKKRPKLNLGLFYILISILY